jgi:RNA polymerase sigma factor (sigma-70 family)
MSQPNPTLLGRWYDAYAARLILYARQWLDPTIAEDVVQSAFLSLAAHRVVPQNAKAWLFTAVRNAAVSEHRSRRRRDAREQQVATDRPDWFEPQPGDLIDASIAQQRLTELPADQREIILLRIWGGLSWPEAAEVLGEPTSTLFSRYKTGLATIRHRMEPSSCNTPTK